MDSVIYRNLRASENSEYWKQELHFQNFCLQLLQTKKHIITYSFPYNNKNKKEH